LSREPEAEPIHDSGPESDERHTERVRPAGVDGDEQAKTDD
jgi:hypothetical protein